MNLTENERSLERKLHVSSWIIAYKMLFGIIEAGFGLIIAIFGRQILRVYTLDLARELSEDPHDLLAGISAKIVPNLLSHNTFLVVYLLLLGAAKIAGAIGLINKQNWGVDLLVGLTFLMLPFQLINLARHPSIFDFFYILIGLLIALYLIEFKPKAWISKVLSFKILS